VLAAAFFAVFWNQIGFVPARLPDWLGGLQTGTDLGVLVWTWLNEADWSHGWIIPLFSAYLVYQRWDKLQATPVRYGWVGLPFILAGILIYVGTLWQILHFGYALPFGMMICLLGVIIMLNGLPAMRYLWLPWLYLFFAIPIPKRLYFAWTNPLRRIAATLATSVLSFWNELDIERVGSNIQYVYKGVQGMIGVADACSGMRSTITLCALGVAVAFLSDRPLWQRIVMVASCLPIAILCNVIRVTITCYLHIFVSPDYATGQYHMMLGLLVLLLAFFIFSGVGWILNHLVVEEEPEDTSTGRLKGAL
jgi:exosortase